MTERWSSGLADSGDMRTFDSALHELVQLQHGLLSIRQLAAHGFARRDVNRRIERGSWQYVTSTVVAMQPIPIGRVAQIWAASLHYEHCAVSGSSVLEILGLPEPTDGLIHIIGKPAGRVTPFAGCIVHTSTEFSVAATGPDRVDTTTAVAQALRWARSDRQGVFHAIWAIQRGHVQLEQLQQLVRELPKSPGSARVRKRLDLIDPGVESMPEYDFAKECRRRGLPEPIRQQRRLDSRGRSRYTDAEFRIGGSVLVVEIDGLGHLEAEVHLDDQWRANELMLQAAPVLRIPSLALRTDPEPFFIQLTKALQQLNISCSTT